MPSPQTILEQYKAYMGDLGNIGSRYATAQAFYASIVSGLLAVLAIKERSTVIADYVNWITVLVCILIAAICWLWHGTLKYYEGLFHAKFDLLRKMENAGALFKIYDPEFKILEGNPYTRGGLIKKEALFPMSLGLIAALTALAVAFQLTQAR
jgi:hypothetical protein